MVAHVQAHTQAPAHPAAVQDPVGFPVGFSLRLTCELSTAVLQGTGHQGRVAGREGPVPPEQSSNLDLL